MKTSKDGRPALPGLLGLTLCVASFAVESDAIAGALDQGRRDHSIMPDPRARKEQELKEDQERKVEARRSELRRLAAEAAQQRSRMEAAAARQTNERVKRWFLGEAEDWRAREKRYLDGIERPFEPLAPLPPPQGVTQELLDSLLPKDFYGTLPKGLRDQLRGNPQQITPPRPPGRPIPFAPPSRRLRGKNLT